MSFSSQHSGLDTCIGIDRDTIVLFDNIPFDIKTDDWKIMLDRVVTSGALNQIRLKSESKYGVRGSDYSVITYFTVVDYICEKDIYSISIKLISSEKLISQMITTKINENEYELSPYVMNMCTDNPNEVICKLINYFILTLN